MGYLNLKKLSNDDILEKLTLLKEELEPYMPYVTDIAIEEANIQFKKGQSSAQVISLLGMWNGMCQAMCFLLYNIKPTLYNVNTARSIALRGVKYPKGSDRKEIVRDNILDLWPMIDWPLMTRGKNIGTPRKECCDMSDSAVIALCHVMKQR